MASEASAPAAAGPGRAGPGSPSVCATASHTGPCGRAGGAGVGNAAPASSAPPFLAPRRGGTWGTSGCRSGQWAPPGSRDDRPVREERRCGWRGPSPPRDPSAPERCSEFTASPGRVNYAVSRDFQVERFSVTLRRNSGLGFEHRPSSAAPRRFPKVVFAPGHSRLAPGSRFPSLAIKKLSLLKSGPRRP